MPFRHFVCRTLIYYQLTYRNYVHWLRCVFDILLTTQYHNISIFCISICSAWLQIPEVLDALIGHNRLSSLHSLCSIQLRARATVLQTRAEAGLLLDVGPDIFKRLERCFRIKWVKHKRGALFIQPIALVDVLNVDLGIWNSFTILIMLDCKYQH